MKNDYADMFALIAEDALARRYFENLPDALRQQIARRAGGIHSMARLKDCAESLSALREG